MGWRGSGGRGAGGSAQAPKPESDDFSLAQKSGTNFDTEAAISS